MKCNYIIHINSWLIAKIKQEALIKLSLHRQYSYFHTVGHRHTTWQNENIFQSWSTVSLKPGEKEGNTLNISWPQWPLDSACNTVEGRIKEMCFIGIMNSADFPLLGYNNFGLFCNHTLLESHTAWTDFCLLQILVSKSTSPWLRKWAVPGWLAS